MLRFTNLPQEWPADSKVFVSAWITGSPGGATPDANMYDSESEALEAIFRLIRHGFEPTVFFGSYKELTEAWAAVKTVEICWGSTDPVGMFLVSKFTDAAHTAFQQLQKNDSILQLKWEFKA